MKGWSLNAKFVAILGIFVAATVAISALSLWRLSDIAESVDTLVGTYAKRVSVAKEMQTLLHEVRSEEKTFILEPSQEGMMKSGVQLDGYEKKLREQLATFEKISAETGKKEAKEVLALLDEWKPISDRIRQLSLEGKNEEATALARGKSGDLLKEFDKKLDESVARYEERMNLADKETQTLMRQTTLTVLIVALASVLTGGSLAFFVLRSVNAAIDKVIANLSDNAQQVASAATQIATTSEELSQSTTEQAASLQETAASVEEMSSMVQKNSENSQRAQMLSSQNETEAGEGTRVVGELLRAMNDIDKSNEDILTQITHSNQQITDIVKVIAEIGNKTRVINDIVFQTKLLSFNASVEAARAGEHGKGFAVVAEEVGNLAQMSGNAAKEISAMLDGSIQKVEGIVHETKARVEGLITTGKSKVAQGLDVAERCERVLQDIARGVSETASMSQSIASASEEQAKGIQEINSAVTQLDRVTQMNASASEEASSAAEQLAAQSETLQQAVHVLVENIWGHSRAAEHKASAPTTPPGRTRPRAQASAPSFSSHASGQGRARQARGQAKPVREPVPAFKDTAHGTPSADDDRFEPPAA